MALAAAIARGEKDALNRMIEANLRLVVKIALDFTGRGVLLDDLIGEGNIGLIHAAEQYEPRYGTRFSTYASFWIKQAIREAIFNSTSLIRVPSHVKALLSKWRKAERSLGELGRTPSFEEVALSLGLSESQKILVSKAQHARRLKLETVVVREVGRWSPIESSDRCVSAERAIEILEDQVLLASRMECLEAGERVVLSMRFGLDNEGPMTLNEVGIELDLTREQVRKIELDAYSKTSTWKAGAARENVGGFDHGLHETKRGQNVFRSVQSLRSRKPRRRGTFSRYFAGKLGSFRPYHRFHWLAFPMSGITAS